MFEQVRAAWNNMEPRQRLGLALVGVATFAGLIAVGYWSSRPTYVVLYSGLASEDAAAVVEELRADKVPYQLGRSGGSIEVPSELLYETRLGMAGKGLPSHSTIGFELFDRSSLPGTDFSNTVNLQRALQGELSRTICALCEVRSARVHLSMPRESLYAEAAAPTASVLLDVGASGTLRAGQVRGIAYLVASAVDNLSPQSVTIVDTFGHVLRGAGSVTGDIADTALSTAKAYSEAMTVRLQGMLDGMFGRHLTIVKVQAEVDMDTEESTEESVEPVSETSTNAVSREHTSEETYSNRAGAGGGVTGVPSTIMGGGAAGTSEGLGSYSSQEQTREYEFSKKTTRKERRPGKVTRLTVAAAIDESLAAQGIDRIREVLEAAAGIDTSRGDSLVVRSLKLNVASLAEEDAKAAELALAAQRRQQTIEALLRRGLPAVLGIVLLALFARTAGAFRNAALLAPSTSASAGENWGIAESVGDDAGAGAPAAESATDDAGGGAEEQAVVDELRSIASEQPEVLAEELRNLVASEDDA